MATGQVISATKPKHRSKEFLNFLRQIEREVPADLDLHIILDNYATHKTEAVEDWLAKRPPLGNFIFTPTHSSWLNQVWNDSLPESPTSASGAASFEASPTWIGRSSNTSPPTTKTRVPSAGRPQPISSSEKSKYYAMNLCDTTPSAVPNPHDCDYSILFNEPIKDAERRKYHFTNFLVPLYWNNASNIRKSCKNVNLRH